MFNVPIPGESLTVEPKSMPYERPPEISDPIEALDLHINNITRPDAMEDMFFFLDSGLDLTSLVEGILRSAVMAGMHSVDVSLIIAPVLHEEIKALALEAGVEFEEGFDDNEEKNAVDYGRDVSRAKNMMKELREKEGEVVGIGVSVMPVEVTATEVEEEEPTKEAPKGLMARG
jgi:hypothetical protein